MIVKQAIFLGFAVAVLGFSFGALARDIGMTTTMACAMSIFVFAGGSQFAALGVLAAGGGMVAAVASGLVLNARYLPLGMSLARVLGGGLGRRALGAHLLVDESAAIGLMYRSRSAYWISAVLLFVFWNVGTLAGTQLARVVDVAVLGVDAAMPAATLALVWPLVKDRRGLEVALVAGAAALVLSPALPSGLPVIVATAIAVGICMWGKPS